MTRSPLAVTIHPVADPLTARGGGPGGRFRLAAALLGLACLPFVLLPLAEAAGIASRSEVLLERPQDTEVKPLEGLFFGSHQQRLVTEITSIRLKSLPEEGDDDPLRVIWVVTMSNSRSITQIVNLKLTLRDEAGERLVTARGRLSVATSTVDKDYEVKMKVKSADWEASRKLELQADWIG